ncbi:A/G-specific adenine glycosylase [Alloprevotella rava]|uniref:Adenine DNA glycosylase n=1 Tax=Alloprevotella rava TaxID=671218 RepID=A0A7W5XWX7_9BACT|nr:A/G-specific adenine glycosylase [Alloprevotella rava]
MKKGRIKNESLDRQTKTYEKSDTSCEALLGNSFLFSSKFASVLLKWYEEHKRSLPWRDTKDPYRIWISEIILQQTRVVQGYDYYLRFLERFPDVFVLAAASEDEVMQQWQGLGYYSRARNLHAAAKTIAALGHFPTTYEEIRTLKGVGDYTAAAISSFAFGLPTAVVDGNVYRVLARHFGIFTPIDTTMGKRVFRELAQQLLDEQHPGDYNQALMDFGALQCTPQSPQCTDCPLANTCVAFSTTSVDQLPVKSKKTEVKTRYFVYLYIRCEGKILLHRRGAGDIWQGLYEPPLFEFNHKVEFDEVVRSADLPLDSRYRLVAEGVKHVLTHRVLLADCYEVNVPAEAFSILIERGYTVVEEKVRSEFAAPRLVTRLYSML